jgi:arylformamidase
MMRNLDDYQVIDISPPISAQTAVFPGDQAFEQNFAMRTDLGQHLTLSSIKTTVHIGAHTDAPNHYASKAESIDQRALHFYLGLVQVITVNCAAGSRVLLKDVLKTKIQAPRVLFKTLSFPDPNLWNSDFVALSAEVIHWLASKKVILVGIDTPSIDLADDKELQSHHTVAKHNMAILEGIVLSKVDEGLYQLIATPLPLAGADASPVRALLLKDLKI